MSKKESFLEEQPFSNVESYLEAGNNQCLLSNINYYLEKLLTTGVQHRLLTGRTGETTVSNIKPFLEKLVTASVLHESYLELVTTSV